MLCLSWGAPQGHVAEGADEERHEVLGGSGWIAGSSCFLPARPGGDCSSHGLLLTDITHSYHMSQGASRWICSKKEEYSVDW